MGFSAFNLHWSCIWLLFWWILHRLQTHRDIVYSYDVWIYDVLIWDHSDTTSRYTIIVWEHSDLAHCHDSWEVMIAQYELCVGFAHCVYTLRWILMVVRPILKSYFHHFTVLFIAFNLLLSQVVFVHLFSPALCSCCELKIFFEIACCIDYFCTWESFVSCCPTYRFSCYVLILNQGNF